MDFPTPSTLEPVLHDAIAIARGAAELLVQGWRKGADVREKARGDLVTEVDLRSERYVRERLGRRYPHHAVVAEEGVGQDHGDCVGGDLVWYVDPLDGTTNFAHGHPFFCVSLALVARGEPVVGVVAAPALGREWWAARGLGAFCNGEPCRVSSTARLDRALLATGFPSWRAERPDNNYCAFVALDAASHGVRRCGAAAIELAMVADGSYDGFWDLGLAPWDIAAGTLLVREAGGLVTDLDAGPLQIDGRRILATNAVLHPQLVSGLSGRIALPPLQGITDVESLRTRAEVR